MSGTFALSRQVNVSHVHDSMASPTRKAPSSQRRLPTSTLLMLGVLLITILNIGSAALLVKLTRNNATTTLRETAAVRSTDREQLRRPPRRAAAPRRFRESGDQREDGNDTGVSSASTEVYHHLTMRKRLTAITAMILPTLQVFEVGQTIAGGNGGW